MHRQNMAMLQGYVLELIPMRRRPNKARSDSVTSGAHVRDKRVRGKHEWPTIPGTPAGKGLVVPSVNTATLQHALGGLLHRACVAAVCRGTSWDTKELARRPQTGVTEGGRQNEVQQKKEKGKKQVDLFAPGSA